MYTISRQFSFCYGHRLLQHSGKCAHPHGHNAIVEIVLEQNSLSADGMVIDFGQLKETIGVWIEQSLDHRMILQADDPLVTFLKAQNEPVYTLDYAPTAEHLAQLIFEKTAEMEFPVVAVRFFETEKCSAEYRR
ncbi:MAG: 6-pyruvoyl trahydropterin synthase family protein [Thermoguttaceae bacterium]